MELGYEEKEVEIALRSLESKAAMQGTEEDIAIIAYPFVFLERLPKKISGIFYPKVNPLYPKLRKTVGHGRRGSM